MLRITPTGFAPIILASTPKPPSAPYCWILRHRVNLHRVDAELIDYYFLHTYIILVPYLQRRRAILARCQLSNVKNAIVP
jgi:hypothetical protein